MPSTVFVLTYMGRAVVATSFFLSSGWKITHPGEFSDAYRRIGPRFLNFSGWIGWVLAVVEIIVGCSILLTGVPRVVIVLPSLLLLAVLSLALLLAPDLQSGCGCWTKPPSTPPRHVYLSRNLILALFALAGLASGPGDSINFGLIALSLIVGGLISSPLWSCRKSGPSGWPAGLQPGDDIMTGALLASYVALWVLVVLLLLLVLLLYRQYGRSLMNTREGIELAGLSLNEKIPALILETNEGQPATVDWLSSPRATAALFALPGCPVCDHLWQEEDIGELAGRWPDVDFVWIDGPTDHLDGRGHLDGWRFLRSPDKSAHRAAEVPASPYVYVVGSNSRVLAKGLINHSGQISNMIAQAFGQEITVNSSASNGHQAAPGQGTRHEVL